MGVTSDVISKGDLTLPERMKFRSSAINAALKRALDLKIATTEARLDVRPFSCLIDASTPLDQWNTAALTAVGKQYSVFQSIESPSLPAKSLCVFYGVAVESSPCPVSLLVFRSGGIVGNIRYQFDLEQLINSGEINGYFSEPIVYDPTHQFTIQVTARIATGAFARVQLKAFMVEPQGQIVAG